MMDSEWTYAALGAAVIGIVFVLFSVWARRTAKGFNNDGALDDRVIKIAELNVEIIQDERKEKQRLQQELSNQTERYTRQTDRFMEIILKQQNDYQSTLERMRTEHAEATKRIHERLDDCSNHHAECQHELASLRSSTASEIRTMQTQMVQLQSQLGITLLQTPPLATPAPTAVR